MNLAYRSVKESQVPYYLLLREDTMMSLEYGLKVIGEEERERKVSVKVTLEEEEGVSECRGLPIDQWNFRFKG